MKTETEKKCQCEFCSHWYPLMKTIESQLNDEGKKLFTELTDHFLNIEEDLNYAECKLNGSWPGWEAMKDFKPKQRNEDEE